MEEGTTMTHQLAIADLATELADPHQHREPRWEWNGSRNKVKLPDHITIQPGLITQLYQAIAPILSKTSNPENGSSHGIARSRPPIQLEALDCYLQITTAIDDWCHHLHIDISTQGRRTVESRLRALAGANATSDETADLLNDLRRWRSWAATLTGWQKIYQPNRAYCPVIECGAQGTLRINLTRKSAVCVVCRSWWDEQTIGLLADHIAKSTDGATAVTSLDTKVNASHDTNQ